MQKILQTLILAMSLVCASAHAQDDHPAQQLVENSVTAMIAVFNEDGERLKSDPEYLQAKVDELLVPVVDFTDMTKLALGKFWRRADATQREQLVSEFKTLLLNTYTSTLTQYSGEKIEFEPYRAGNREDRADVRSTFFPSASEALPVLYRLRKRETDTEWKIYDIVVDSLSLASSYRSGFSREIEKAGIDGLIESLRERNDQS